MLFSFCLQGKTEWGNSFPFLLSFSELGNVSNTHVHNNHSYHDCCGEFGLQVNILSRGLYEKKLFFMFKGNRRILLPSE